MPVSQFCQKMGKEEVDISVIRSIALINQCSRRTCSLFKGKISRWVVNAGNNPSYQGVSVYDKSKRHHPDLQFRAISNSMPRIVGQSDAPRDRIDPGRRRVDRSLRRDS